MRGKDPHRETQPLFNLDPIVVTTSTWPTSHSVTLHPLSATTQWLKDALLELVDWHLLSNMSAHLMQITLNTGPISQVVAPHWFPRNKDRVHVQKDQHFVLTSPATCHMGPLGSSRNQDPRGPKCSQTKLVLLRTNWFCSEQTGSAQNRFFSISPIL